MTLAFTVAGQYHEFTIAFNFRRRTKPPFVGWWVEGWRNNPPYKEFVKRYTLFLWLWSIEFRHAYDVVE